MKFESIEEPDIAFNRIKIHELEKLSGAQLPESLKDIVINHGISRCYPNVFSSKTDDTRLVKTIDLFLGFSKNPDDCNHAIDITMKFLASAYEYPLHCIPFCVSNTEYFMIDLKDRGTIKFVWTPEDYFEFEKNSFVVAKNFDDFMTKVTSDDPLDH